MNCTQRASSAHCAPRMFSRRQPRTGSRITVSRKLWLEMMDSGLTCSYCEFLPQFASICTHSWLSYMGYPAIYMSTVPRSSYLRICWVVKGLHSMCAILHCKMLLGSTCLCGNGWQRRCLSIRFSAMVQGTRVSRMSPIVFLHQMKRGWYFVPS